MPKITVITRKAYGGAYDVMESKQIGADFNFAWPTAEIAVMGAEGAVNIIFRRELPPPMTRRRTAAEADRRVQGTLRQPLLAAERGYIDDVIDPPETRPKVITALHTLQTKRQPGPNRKHGNIPL